MFLVKNLQLIIYQDALVKMQNFTDARQSDTPDEIWFCEHPPVLTMGRHAEAIHILNAHDIPVVQTDRGGQVTYHGPGQLMVYCLVDLKRKKTGVANFVDSLEEAVIQTLKDFGITAGRRKNMPGVYVNDAKICSIGLRVKQGCTYHGLALNINMDLTPFTYINPCGYESLKVTQMANFVPEITVAQVQENLMKHLFVIPA